MRAAVAFFRLAIIGLGTGAPLVAQDASVRGPLQPLADHPVPVLPAPPLPLLLIEAPPVVGLFGSAGIAAGLPRDVSASRGLLRIGTGNGWGGYRRPFDPNQVSAWTVRAAGWQPVGQQGAAWGRVAVEDGGREPAGFSSYTNPYGSAPLVLADTSTPKLHRVRATLEGATGWRAGGWLFGIAAGLDVIDDGTRDARLVRTNRASVPAVQLSVGRDLVAGLTLVLHGRWTGGSETVAMRPEPGATRTYGFFGFDDPLPTDVVPPGAYLQRTQKDGYGGGISLAGRLFGAPWVLSAVRTYRHDIHFSDFRQDPPSDEWTADGWTIILAHQRRLPIGLTGTLQLDGSRLVGDVTLQNVEGVVARVRETMLEGSLDLRAAPGRHVQTALRLGLGMSRRELTDFLVRVPADLTVWRPSAVAEVAYTAGGSSASLAAGIAGAGPYATLPTPTAMGPVYQQFLAPTWSRDATRATTLLGAITVRRSVSTRLALLAQAGVTDLSPRGTPVLASPTGRYREWRVGLGIVGM